MTQEEIKHLCGALWNVTSNKEHKLLLAEGGESTKKLFAALDKLIRTGVLLHSCANKLLLDKVPKRFMTKENVMALDYNKNTVIHFAAASRVLHHIPSEFLTKEAVLQKNRALDSVLQIAARKQLLHLIPNATDLLTPDRVAENNSLHLNIITEVAQIGGFEAIPIKALTPENLLAVSNINRRTPLHTAAEYKTLSEIPQEAIIKAFQQNPCLAADIVRFALVYDAAEQLPPEVFTSDLLLTSQVHLYQTINKSASPKIHNVLENIKAEKKLDLLLGLELDERCRLTTGDEWWQKNQAVLKGKEDLKTTEISELDIF